MPLTLTDITPDQDRHLLSASVHIVSKRSAALLPEDDRAILGLLQSDPPSSLRQMATLLNLNPGTLSRRITRIHRRLRHPVVASLVTRGHTLSTRFFNIARALFAAGQPARTIARAFNAEDREILAIKRYIEGWSKSASS